MLTRSSRNKAVIFIYSAVFLVVWVLLFLKCRYGFPSDESYYMLVIYRVINGDIPILHDWHPAQISEVWIHPIISMFLKITGSTAGIFLFFRYVYTVVWGSFALFVFIKLRKINETGAAIVSLVLMIYVPYGEMALYYNTICIMTLVSFCCIMLTAERYKPLQYTIAGFLLAVSFTCCPYLAVLYIAIAIYVIKQKKVRSVLSFLTIGAIIAFILFYLYYFSRIPITELPGELKHLMTEREHQFSAITKMINYLEYVLFPTNTVLICIVAFAICCIIVRFLNTHRAIIIGFLFTVLVVITIQGNLMIENDYINNYMLAPSVIGLYVRLNSKNAIIRKAFLYMWVPGAVYSFCINLSSNLGFSSVASAATVMTAASLIMATVFITDEIEGNKIPVVAFAILISFQLGLQLNKRMNYVFEPAPIDKMTETIDHGVMKGLKVTPGRVDYYKWMTIDTQPLQDDSLDQILIFSKESWIYLDLGKNTSAYSSWIMYFDEETLKLCDEYYTLYPEKKPDAVYVESYYTDIVPLLEERGYHGNKTVLGGYILYPDQQ